jgi:hypothetical protein
LLKCSIDAIDADAFDDNAADDDNAFNNDQDNVGDDSGAFKDDQDSDGNMDADDNNLVDADQDAEPFEELDDAMNTGHVKKRDRSSSPMVEGMRTTVYFS